MPRGQLVHSSTGGVAEEDDRFFVYPHFQPVVSVPGIFYPTSCNVCEGYPHRLYPELTSAYHYYLAIPQCAHDPQRRAPPLALLIGVALPDPNSLWLPLATLGLQEDVSFVSAILEVNLRNKALIERFEETLERYRFLVCGGWSAPVVLED